MNRKMIGGLSVVFVLGLMVSLVRSCPEHEAAAAAGNGDTEAVAADAKTTPCSKSKAVALADDKSGGCGKDCEKDCCEKKAGLTTAKAKGGCNKPCNKKSASADGGCPIGKKVAAVLESLPKMKYRVGDEVTGCSKSAAAMAEKADKPVEYVVSDEVVADEGEATVKLTALLEKEMEDLQAVQYVVSGKCMRCPQSAKSIAEKTKSSVAYRVGGVDFAKKEDAEKALEAIREAVTEVTMAYKVDGKTYKCNKQAGEKCKKSGKKLTYVVGGEETCCKTTAQLKLTEARVRTIVQTAVSTSFSL